jgi:hypothetical protein
MELLFALLLAANVSSAHAAPTKPSKPTHRTSIVRVAKPHILVSSKYLHRMGSTSGDADDENDEFLPSAEIVAKPRKPLELDDNVRRRLLAARLLALAKHKDMWG